MRRSASEIINELETRIAQLEKNANTALSNEEFSLLAEVVYRLDNNSPLYMLGESLPPHFKKEWSDFLKRRGPKDVVVKELIEYSKRAKAEQEKVAQTLEDMFGFYK